MDARNTGISSEGPGSVAAARMNLRARPVAALSFVQRLLLQSDQPSRPRSIALRLHFKGQLDRRALRAALDRIVERHEVLRTSFESKGGEPVALVGPGEMGFDLTEEPVESKSMVEQIRRQEMLAPFALSRGPLIRGRLLEISEQEHVLIITQHAMVGDGLTSRVLIRELCILYGAFALGHADPLPPLNFQYEHYAAFQREQVDDAEFEKQFDFWKQKLSDAGDVIQMRTDRPRSVASSRTMQTLQVGLSQGLTSRVRELAREFSSTAFETLFGSWALLLGRWSGQEEVLIGTPMTPQLSPQAAALIGNFENMVALRVQLAEDLNSFGLLKHVKGLMAEARANLDVPVEQVIGSLESASARGQLLQIYVSPNGVPASIPKSAELQRTGLTLADIYVDDTNTDVELSLQVAEDETNLTATVRFASELFSHATIERLVASWKVLLEGMSADNQRPLYELPLLTAAERRQVVCDFNSTAQTFPSDRSIHQFIEDHAQRAPTDLAVVYEDGSLTYGELNARANQLARYLRTRGVSPDEIVGLCVERGLDMVIGLLGIWKAGGAYVPLDPSYPPDLLAYMIQDCAPRTVLILERFRHLVPTGINVVSLDSQWDAVAEQEISNLTPAELFLVPQHLAYVIYTSGSTGKPKGVMVEHRNVVNLWQALEQDIYRNHPNCRAVGVNASLAFDSSVKQLVQLLSGRTLFPVPQSVRLDAMELLKFIVKHRLDSLDCTPTQLSALIAAGLLRDASQAPKIMLLGGEHIDETVWCPLATCSQPIFYNVYGPTECTVDATIALLRHSPHTPTIGRPIANGRIYMLDSRCQPVSIGAVGEIYIGGVGVGRGYLNRPELTAHRFLPDPFDESCGFRMYKTGDIGRWGEDGCIEYLGRNDQQVKIRGFRIELAEIEAQLRRDVRVSEAVVIAREDILGDKRLVGYIVPAGWQANAAVAGEGEQYNELLGDLRESLTRTLPPHMIPATLIKLERLPLTANGKLDRRKLPAPEEVSRLGQRYAAPSTLNEQELCQIWQEVFSMERVGVEDNFFELGGHSMLAMQLSVLIYERLDAHLPFLAMFEYPTVRQLAQVVEQLANMPLPLPGTSATELDAFADGSDGRTR